MEFQWEYKKDERKKKDKMLYTKVDERRKSDGMAEIKI
jgi:hypothetical protein